MSGSTLTTAPALEPVTLEEARSQCRLTDSSEDGLLAGYLLAARSLAEKRTGRVLITQTWTETFDHCWPTLGRHHHNHFRPLDGAAPSYSRRCILLQKAPVQSVASITYVDTNGAPQTLDPSQYQVGKRLLVGAIEEAYGVSWPAVRWQMDAVSVQYVAGYASPGLVPETIRQAILLLVDHFFENRSATVISMTRMSVSELPSGVDVLLAHHEVPWVF